MYHFNPLWPLPCSLFSFTLISSVKKTIKFFSCRLFFLIWRHLRKFLPPQLDLQGIVQHKACLKLVPQSAAHQIRRLPLTGSSIHTFTNSCTMSCSCLGQIENCWKKEALLFWGKLYLLWLSVQLIFLQLWKWIKCIKSVYFKSEANNAAVFHQFRLKHNFTLIDHNNFTFVVVTHTLGKRKYLHCRKKRLHAN